MASDLLIKATSPFVTLELHGPAISFRFHSTHAVSDGLLDVSSTRAPLTVVALKDNGVATPWRSKERGPAIREETNYNLRVKSRVAGIQPILVHRDPLLLANLVPYQEDLMWAGPINFRSQVGLSTLEVRVGNEALYLTMEVFPSKIDYERDYEILLREVAKAGRGLALEYLRSTYRSGTSEKADDTSGLEWLTLLRNQVETLQKAIVYIDQHPHRALVKEPEQMRAEAIKRVDSTVRRAVLRGRGSGPWIDVPRVGRVHSLLPSLHSRETVDTPEHRWIRLNLLGIRQRLSELSTALAREAESSRATGRPLPKRLLAERSEVSHFMAAIERLLQSRVVAELNGAPPSGFASLTLLSAPGYSEAYKAIMVLRLGLKVSGDPFDLSVKDVHALYETWCFIELVRLAASLADGRADTTQLLHIESSGIRVRLKRGDRSSVRLSSENRVITVAYNPNFTGLTGDQRPDIILRFQQDGWPDIIVVFDAKYRIDASKAYADRFGLPGPPQDAINALHRYRDAIVIDTAERGLERPVVRGVALYPLSGAEAESFPASVLAKALDVLGIGAIPFLPAQTHLVEEWLKDLLSLSTEELALAGPPFAALRERQRRADGHGEANMDRVKQAY